MTSNNLIFLSVIMLFAIGGCKENIDDINEGIIKKNYTIVRTQKINKSTEPIPIYAIGRLQSDKDIKLSFKIGGIISKISADEGDYVKKGQHLAKIRTNEIDAQVLKAERAVEKSKRDLLRVTNMYNDGAATLEQIQDLTTLVAVGQADLDIATFNRQYATIVSPVSGRIIKRLAEPNELINPGKPVLILSSSSGNNYVMTAAVSDKTVNEISLDDEAVINFDAFDNELLKGSIVQIGETADPRTGTFEVDIRLNPNHLRLRNGTIGRITIKPNISTEYGLIPLDAIVETKDQEIIIFSPTQGDSIAREWSAPPLRIIDKYALIDVENIKYNEVITDGSSYLIDGDKINIK